MARKYCFIIFFLFYEMDAVFFHSTNTVSTQFLNFEEGGEGIINV